MALPKLSPPAMMLFALLAAGSLVLLQRAFDGADHRKAELLVRTFQPAGGRPLVDVLAARDPRARADAAWSTEILSGCRGFVRVRCMLPDGPYDFGVDLVKRSIHPANGAGELALQEASAPAPTPKPAPP